MPHGIPDTRQFPWDQALSHNLQQLTNKVTGGINTWAVRPTVGVDGAPLGPNHVGYTGINTNSSAIERWDGSTWTTLLDGDRVVSTTHLDVYVSQNTGNDNNDGRSASTAWKSISKFYQELHRYNLLGKQVNLYLGAGTYRLQFPPSTWNGVLRIYGASSNTVTIQSMVMDKATTVLLQDVTLAFPQLLDTTTHHWVVQLTNGSSLRLGQNVVLGPVGNYFPNTSGYSRIHILADTSSWVYLHAAHPITLSGSVNSVFTLGDSRLQILTHNATPGQSTPQPSLAPTVDTGISYNLLPAPTSSDTVAVVNAVGTITVNNFLRLTDSTVGGPPNWKLNLTGTVNGLAYVMTSNSIIYGNVARGSVPTTGIGYPSSISSGTRDDTSTIQGTWF